MRPRLDAYNILSQEVLGVRYQAAAVANFFVQRGLREGQPVDPMKLQKLIYFAHGWHLAIHGEPLIDERIEAWSYGPVVPSIYHAVKHHGSAPIDFPIFRQGPGGPQAPAVADDRSRALLERIWDVYGKYSSVQLSRMSHDPDGPWSATWRDEAMGGTVRGVDISDGRIEDYFVALGQPGAGASG